MNTTRASRPIPIALTGLVAFVSAVAALAVSNGMNMAQAHGNATHNAHAPMQTTKSVHHAPKLSAKAVALREDMRKLWEDHITWTRLAIISLETGTPDTDATVGRLLQNQTDIGNAVKPFYGDAAGNELTRQLRAHILIAADVIRRSESRRQRQARRRAGPLDRERGPDRGRLEQRQPAPLDARRAESGDAHAPRPDNRGSGRQAAGRLDGRRRRVRQGARAHPAHVGSPLRRHRQAIPEAVPLAPIARTALPPRGDHLGADAFRED
jgi:hypothetical protein